MTPTKDRKDLTPSTENVCQTITMANAPVELLRKYASSKPIRRPEPRPIAPRTQKN
jgi:hypothetical protein